MHHFAYRNGVLHAEGVNLDALAAKVGTPFYCYSTATLTRHYNVFAGAFADVDALVCYAMKANSNQAVIKTLARLGAGADVVRVELSRDESFARHVTGIEGIVDLLAGVEHVAEAEDLQERGEQDGVAVGDADAHRLAEEALVDDEPAVHVLAEQVELSGLVGRDGEADPAGAEKRGEPGRHGVGDGLRCRR